MIIIVCYDRLDLQLSGYLSYDHDQSSLQSKIGTFFILPALNIEFSSLSWNKREEDGGDEVDMVSLPVDCLTI